MSENLIGYPFTRDARIPADPSGLLVISMPTFTIGLVVHANKITAAPPYGRKLGLVGRNAREVWRDYARRGADLFWLPDKVSRRTSG